MCEVTYQHTDADSFFVTSAPGIIAVVSKNKILSISGTDIFSENYETAENIPVNFDADQALVKLKEYLSNLVQNYPTKYYSCKSVYIPYCGLSDNMTVTFKPAWEFAGYTEIKFNENESQGDLFLNRVQHYEYFWADTGHKYIEIIG